MASVSTRATTTPMATTTIRQLANTNAPRTSAALLVMASPFIATELAGASSPPWFRPIPARPLQGSPHWPRRPPKMATPIAWPSPPIDGRIARRSSPHYRHTIAIIVANPRGQSFSPLPGPRRASPRPLCWVRASMCLHGACCFSLPLFPEAPGPCRL